jgi:hypothetical protein
MAIEHEEVKTDEWKNTGENPKKHEHPRKKHESTFRG